jgi:hypothetical protein
MIKIPAKITKTQTGRTTFISKEAASFLRPKLKNLEDNDLIFGSNENVNYARTTEVITLERVLQKDGLNQKWNRELKKITRVFVNPTWIRDRFAHWFFSLYSKETPDSSTLVGGSKRQIHHNKD